VNALEVAAKVCTLVEAPSLLVWLDVPSDAEPDVAREALRRRRRQLQAHHSNPKYREVARLVIGRYRLLDHLLMDVEAYLRAVERERVRAQLPLLDMGVDGVLADGTVTAEELAFLEATARRLGVDADLALGRLRLRADEHGVALGADEAVPVVAGAPHPLLPSDWWSGDVARWIAAQIPAGTRRVVDVRCGSGAVALSLATLRPELQVLGFDVAERTEQAERVFDAAGVDAVALPARAEELPLDPDSADLALFVVEEASVAALAEARRVVGHGTVLTVDVGVPRATLGGPLPQLDAALWELCRAAELSPARPCATGASTFVVTRTLVGDGPALAAVLLGRLAAVMEVGRLSEAHPAVRAVARALEELGEREEGSVATYEVPLVATTR